MVMGEFKSPQVLGTRKETKSMRNQRETEREREREEEEEEK
jgi:hypothetical protein